jgi:hypothetical protein
VNKADLAEMAKLVKLVGMLSQTKVYLFWATSSKLQYRESKEPYGLF